ncbi:hypothetical protein ACJJTC_000137 [Scirpophaga incertulas]
MSCARCEDAHIQTARLERINKELKDLRYGEADEKIRLLMDAREKSDRQRNEAFDETDRATADYDRMEKEGVAECEAQKKGETPKCVNCTKANNSDTSHNAFSSCCPIKQKWDSIARARVAYK